MKNLKEKRSPSFLRIRVAYAILLFSITAAPEVALSLPPDFELTPIIGYRGDIELQELNNSQTVDINGSNSVGILADWRSGPATQWELMYSLQQTDVRVSSLANNIDLDIHYLQIGGIHLLEEVGLNGFVGFTLGATHVNPSGYDSENLFSFAFTGGLKFFPHRHIGLRLDGRTYANVISGSGAILCSGGCVAQFKGDLIWQLEGNLGLIIRF